MSIKVETKGIIDSLNEFKKEMKNLDNLYDELTKMTNETKKTWEGNASDETLADIEEFEKEFEDIRKQNEKYVTFLNSVIDKYTEEDESDIKSVDLNMDYYDVDGI